jgi:NosR/NirI family transcriptional regulator, nitrous oxide reductase regulator
MHMAKFKVVALQAYRFAALALIVWFVRDHHIRQRNFGDKPVEVAEVQHVYPNAVSLRPDHSERAGLFVEGADGRQLGYVVRTLPECNHIIGYCGVTDLFVLFDPSLKVLGWKVRSTEDTRSHMNDIVTDRKFPKKWNGLTWDAVAGMDLKAAGIEGVSGATMTSMAMAQSIVHRLKTANQRALHHEPWRFAARDWALVGALLVGGLLTFTRLHEGRRWLRRGFQAVLIGWIGFVNGDLIAQSLLAGWAKSGMPWQLAPGLVLLVAAALLVPWATKKPLYCQQLCPHGAAQEWLGRVGMKNKLHVPAGLGAGLQWLPGLSLVFVLLVVMLQAPFDLAGLEPFDAWVIQSAGWATITVALVGLVASLFIPQAYCRYGCPTGALLEFVRSHGRNDRFSRRDVAAALLVALAFVIRWQYPLLQAWLRGFE